MTDFEQTPEAQEYISKLQSGRVELTEDATALESVALQNLRDAQGRIRQITTAQGDLEKQIKNLEAQRGQMSKELDMMSGEATGYARMLVSAEGARRTPAQEAPEGQIAKGGNGADEPAEVAPKQDANDKPAGKPKTKAKGKPKLQAVESEATTN